MYLPLGPSLDTLDGALDLGDQRQTIARVARIALGRAVGKDKTGRWVRRDAGLAAKLCRAIALAFDHGGHGGIVGVHHLTVAALLALGEPGGLGAQVRRVAHGHRQRTSEPLTLGLTQRRRLCKTRLGLLAKGCDGFPQFQALVCGVAHELDENVPLAATTSAQAPPHFFARLPQDVDVAVELGGAAAALLRDVGDELESFLCAFYSVVASVTR